MNRPVLFSVLLVCFLSLAKGQDLTLSCPNPIVTHRKDVKTQVPFQPVVHNWFIKGCDWQLRFGSCYLVVDTLTLPWAAALATCQSYGGKLVEPAGLSVTDEVGRLVESQSSEVKVIWIGYRVGNSDVVGFWSDGVETTVDVGVWGSQEPNTAAGNCAYMQKTSAGWIWHIGVCDSLMPFICEAQPCPSGSYHCDNGKCVGSLLVCNNEDNCGDNSDERDCASLCRSYYSAREGNITHPQSILHYLDSSSCQWVIETAIGSMLQIKFLSLETEEGLDFVEIWVGGRTMSSSRLIRRLSGSSISQAGYILSSNNMALIRFVSDSTQHYGGFRLQWRSDFECGFQLVSNSHYRDSNLKSTSVSLSRVDDCQQECLNRVACTAFSFNRDTRRCTILSEMPLPVTDTCCDIYYKTCPDQTSYATVSSMPNLGGNLIASSSVARLSSPLYPFYYSGGLDVAWTITSPGQRIITLEVLDKDLAMGDYVSVFNGNGPSSPLLATIDASSSVSYIMTTCKAMYLYFHSSFYTPGKRGFLFMYKAGCDYVTTSSSGSITSPGYSLGSYPNILTCTWQLSSPNNSPMRLTFNSPFSLEEDDFLEVFQGTSTLGSSLHTGKGFTGSTLPPSLDSPYGQLYLRLSTSAVGTNRGFNATFSTGCPLIVDSTLKIEPVSYGRYVGDEVTVSCVNNYRFTTPNLQFQSSVTMTCETGGHWNFNPIPTCSRVFCGTPPMVSHAHLVSSSGLYSGDIATYVCETGYSLASDSASITCLSTASWDVPPTCTGQRCSSLQHITAGHFMVLVGDGTEEGSVAQYQCDSGYDVNGAATLVCSRGRWSQSTPSCEKRRCSPPYVVNGTISPSSLVYMGDQLSLTCNQGFQLVGRQRFQCGLEQPGHCANIDECANGLAGCAHSCVDTVGSFICSCREGYTLSGRQCIDINECLVNNGNCDHFCTNTIGSYQCSCQAAYVLYQSHTSIEKDPFISYVVDHSCVKMSCPAADLQITNGYALTSRRAFSSGEHITYLCNLGYTMQGAATLTCQDGRWNASPPTCVAAMCPALASQSGNTNTAQVSPTTSIAYQDYFDLTCAVAGLGDYVTKQRCVYHRNTDTYRAASEDLSCFDVNCGAPERLHGTLPFEYTCTTYNCQFSFQCRSPWFTLQGLSSIGDSIVRCSSDGKWDFGDLRCPGPTCSDPGTPPGGVQEDEKYTTYEEYSLVRYSCERDGFLPTHRYPLQCIWYEDRKILGWNTTRPECTDQESPFFYSCPLGVKTVTQFSPALYSEPIPSDNSGLVRGRSVTPPNFQSYTTVVTRDMEVVYTATDHENNVGTCVVNIKILDDEPPTMTCKNSTEVHIRSSNDEQTFNTQDYVIMASDNSGNVILTYSIKQLTLDRYSIDKLYTVFVTALDEVGNQEKCMVQVLVTAPKCQTWILNVKNGQSSCLRYGSGYRCTISCKSGYVFYENDRLQSIDLHCSPGGDWDRKQPVCVLQDSLAYRITTRLGYQLGSATTITEECRSSYQQQLMSSMSSLVASLTSLCGDVIPHVSVAEPNRQNFHSVTVSGTFRDVTADITVELPPFGLSLVTYQQCSQRIRSAFSSMTSSVSAVASLSSTHNCPASTTTTYQTTPQDGIGCYGAAEIRTAIDNSQTCVSCPPGYVSIGSGNCVQCPFGQYRDPAVSNVCLQCPSVARTDPTSQAITTEAECYRVCPRGMFSETGSAPCNMCPPDTYSVNTTTCIPCSVGTYTRGPGQTSLSACQMECVPGSFSSSGFSPCRLCPRGFYQPHTRMSVCLECMDSETTGQEGSTLPTQCVAAASFLCGPNPCKNGGQCIITGHDYQCICSSPMYTGRTCDTELDPCTSRPCYNKGSCRNNKDGTYSCFCGTTRITGDRCEMDINDCEVNPCQNSGVCQDKLRSYTCHCPLFTGYTGSRCEILRSPCSLEPCPAFNSRCVESGNIRRNCICNRGFMGDNCEINIDDCSPNPCLNGGTCIDQVDGVLCQCRHGYKGEMCEERNSPCAVSPCGSQATCIDNYKLETVVCQCPTGYEEVNGRCQQVNLCNSFPCQNGGQCLFMEGRYQCSCPTGYDGLRCEHDVDNCTPNPCRNNGVCTDLFNDFKCDCDPNMTQTGGKLCDDLEDNCTPYPCDFTHSKSCVDRYMDFYCNCYDGYHGKRCSLGDMDCSSFPCHHGATCIQDGNSYACQCPAGYNGAHCELETNYCTQNPCLNNGKCISADNTYVCKCELGYRGDNCETYYDLCQIANPCIGPGSTCTFDGFSTSCKCASGYSGLNCETKALSCYNGYCMNDGTCLDDGRSLHCTCLSGFSGDRCEENINDCLGNDCPTGSTCIDGINSFTCKCQPGKIGPQCSKDLSTDFDVIFPGALSYPPPDYQSTPQPLSSTQLSLSVWVKYEQQTTPGTIATLYGVSSASSTDNPQELITLQRQRMTASFSGQQQLPYTNIDDGYWHNVIVVWDSSRGTLSLYVDAVLVGTLNNYGIGARLSSYGWLVLDGTYDTSTHTIDQTHGMIGRISRLHITNTALSYPADIQQLYSDINAIPPGDIVGFNTDMVDGINGVLDYQSQLTAGTCLMSDVTCRTLTQITTRPSVLTCPTDQMMVTSRVSIPRWTEPTFEGHRTIRTTSVSGATTMGWGTYGIAYAAIDDQQNAAICSFKFFNRRIECDKPMRPMSGRQECSVIPNGMRCSVQCLGSLAMSVPGPKYYSCGTYGIYGATDRPVPFEYAACTSCTTPARDVTITLNFRVTPTCSSTVQNNLRDSILSALARLNVQLSNVMCNTADCQNVNINLVCSALTTVISSTISLPLVSEDNVLFESERRPARDFLVIAIVDRQIFNFAFATPIRDTFEINLKMTCAAGKQLIGDCCVECGQGSYYDSSVRSCVPCDKGTYLDEMGIVVGSQTPCITCPGSMTTATTGAQSVDKCKDSCIQGEFYNLTEGQCISCPIGFYQSNSGSFYCDPCDVTKSTAYSAQTSVTSCVIDPQVTVSPTSTQGPTAGASTGSSFSSEMIAIIIIVVIILIVLLVILLLCCCRDWVEKMCPCLIVKVGPEYEEKWHYVDRFGETNMKFVSYKLSDYRAKKMDKQHLVESDSEKSHTNISVHLPMFEEKLNGTVSMKPVLISSMEESGKENKPRKPKHKRSKKHKDGHYQYGQSPTALSPLPDRLRADTLLYASRRSELDVTYEVPVERSDEQLTRPPSAFNKKRPTMDDVPHNEFVQSTTPRTTPRSTPRTTPRTTPRSRIMIEDDEDLR